MNETKLNRREAPAVAAPRSTRFPPIEEFRDESGLRILFVEDRSHPLVTLRCQFAAGALQGDLLRPGLSSLAMDLVTESTVDHNAIELSTLVEDLGGELGSGASWDAGWVGTSGLASVFSPLGNCLVECVGRPAFDSEDLERQRARRIGRIGALQDEASVAASWALAQILYGETAFGWPLLGHEPSLGAVKRDELLEFWGAARCASTTVLCAVGDLDSDRLADLAHQLGRALPAPPRAELEPPVCDEPDLPPILIIDRPDAAQTHLLLGRRGPGAADPDRLPLRVLNALFGGKFSSRLNLSLRERHGFTYGIGSGFAVRRGSSVLQIETALSNEVVGAALGEIRRQLELLHHDPPSEQEVTGAKGYLAGLFPYSLQTQGGLLAQVAEIAQYDLPLDEPNLRLHKMSLLEAGDLLPLAPRWFAPESFVAVAVGPAAQLGPQLESMGPVIVRSAAIVLPREL